MDELRYTHAIARQAGIEAELLLPSEVSRLWPLASTEGLHDALPQSRDGSYGHTLGRGCGLATVPIEVAVDGRRTHRRGGRCRAGEGGSI
jgi:hypothetical protein